MNHAKTVLLTVFTMAVQCLPGQQWSLGMDMISLGRVFGEENMPIILQVRKDVTERGALRMNFGVLHSSKNRKWDYFNSVHVTSINDYYTIWLFNDFYREINDQFQLRIGWQQSLSSPAKSFAIYNFSGVLAEYSKNKRYHKLLDDAGIPWPRPLRSFIYSEPEFNNRKFGAGIFTVFGVEVKLNAKFSIALESEISGAFYSNVRFEGHYRWVFGPNEMEPPPGGYVDVDNYYDEKGFELRGNAIQYIFVRYAF